MERFYVNSSAHCGTESSFSAFTLSTQSTHGLDVIIHGNLVLLVEFSHTLVNQTVVKVFSTKMGITSGGFYLKDTFIN